MENKQTTVDYLIRVLTEHGFIDLLYTLPESKLWTIIEQVKEMEEKQHSNTFLAGGKSAFNAAKGRDFTTFEDYYNETYKSE